MLLFPFGVRQLLTLCAYGQIWAEVRNQELSATRVEADLCGVEGDLLNHCYVVDGGCGSGPKRVCEVRRCSSIFVASADGQWQLIVGLWMRSESVVACSHSHDEIRRR